MTTGVVVPLRGFSDGKARLEGRLDPAGRARLVRTMADRVVAAARGLPVLVVSSAPDVAEWADALGLACLPDPGTLDGAATAGRAWWASEGADRVVIAHADLPLADDLAALAVPGAAPLALVVPCHRGDGTPVLSLPAGGAFDFAYGPGSFLRHVAEARHRGLEVVELWDRHDLRRDVDSVDDLLALETGLGPLP